MLDIKMIVIRRTFHRHSWPNFQVVSALLKGWGGDGRNHTGTYEERVIL